MSVQKTVFISYRRTNIYTARAVYQTLKQHDYDVFLDYDSIDNGSFERIILSQIRARGHFLLILTPDTLERCTSPQDWVRREIECALDSKRNIVPLMFDQFNFATHAQPYLTGKLEQLPAYNSLNIYADYFEEGMQKLIDRFLSQPINTVPHPVNIVTPTIPESKISLDDLRLAEEAIDDGKRLVKQEKWKDAWQAFSKALKVNPQYADAYYERGLIAKQFDRLDLAIEQMTQCIEHDDLNFQAFCARGEFYLEQKDYLSAITDFSSALRLNPPYVSAYTGRGQARMKRGDFTRAVQDFEKAIQLAPHHPTIEALLDKAKKKRNKATNPVKRMGTMLGVTGADHVPETAYEYYKRATKLPIEAYDDRIADLTQAIELNPEFRQAYFSRGSTYYHHSKFEESLADDTMCIDLLPDGYIAYANRAEVYLAMHDFDNAYKDLNKSLKFRPDNVFAEAALAIALFHMGQLEDAEKIWLRLEKSKQVHRNVERTADMLNWHPNITELAQALVDALD